MDDVGILYGDEQFPFYGIEITKDQLKLIGKRIAGIYEVEGKQLFEIRDETGKLTGNKMLYVVFI